jgi:hypothetical protein
MLIRRISRLTGKSHEREIPCTLEQLAAWAGGKFIQDAMPDVSAEDREFVISGITPEEWKQAFGEAE